MSAGAVNTADEFAALIESCKADNLPAGLTWEQRRQAEAAMRRAKGWLRSSLFSMQSSETRQHVEALLAARSQAVRHG